MDAKRNPNAEYWKCDAKSLEKAGELFKQRFPWWDGAVQVKIVPAGDITTFYFLVSDGELDRDAKEMR